MSGEKGSVASGSFSTVSKRSPSFSSFLFISVFMVGYVSMFSVFQDSVSIRFQCLSDFSMFLISECKLVEDSHEGNRACRSKSGARLSDFRVQRYNISDPNARIICIDMCIDMCIAPRKSHFSRVKTRKKPEIHSQTSLHRINERSDIRSLSALALYTIVSTSLCDFTPFILLRRSR